MINTTVIALNILSLTSCSPFLTMYNINKGKLSISICNSQISYLFNSFIQSYTLNHQTLIKNTIISHTLNSAIKFSSEDTGSCSIFPNFPFEVNKPIDNKEFNGKTCDAYKDCHLSFNGNCGNLIITKCTFQGCHSKESGGSISIIQDCTVTIHGTIFDDSETTNGRYGGAVCIIKSKGDGYDKPEWADINNGEIQKLDVQYCCFSNCRGSDILMGVAILCSADQMMLYFASTTNCPGELENKASGAQFDIQAKNVTSHHVNCSGGYSNYCSGIEYRYASTGFFKYQTITGITCMFGVSYTNLVEKSDLEKGIELSDSNIIDITLERASGLLDGNVHSGLIHVRQTAQITIENFCFIDSNLDDQKDNQRIISKGTKDGYIQSIKVIFKNCYYDCENNMIALDTSANMLGTISCVPNTKTLNEIDQLLLGECQGNEEPVPFTPTNTKGFSNSDYFTNSKYFTKSNDFTYSHKFDATDVFSKSDLFTESNSFISNYPPGKSVDKDKPNAGMIAGISVGVVAAVAIIALAAFFIIKKRRMIPKENDLETFDENTGSVTNSNPIYGKGEDDPFKEDFK